MLKRNLAGLTKEKKEKSMTYRKKEKKKKEESLEVRKPYTNPARKNGTIT